MCSFSTERRRRLRSFPDSDSNSSPSSRFLAFNPTLGYWEKSKAFPAHSVLNNCEWNRGGQDIRFLLGSFLVRPQAIC